MADERDAALSVPATLINRFWVEVTDDRTRICFGESDGGRCHYHFAISVEHASATALVELIRQVHSEHVGKAGKRA